MTVTAVKAELVRLCCHDSCEIPIRFPFNHTYSSQEAAQAELSRTKVEKSVLEKKLRDTELQVRALMLTLRLQTALRLFTRNCVFRSLWPNPH